MMMMQYKGSISNRTKKLRRCLQAALFAKCNEERQVKNTCKFRAAGDSIFLLTFNLLYMLCEVLGQHSFSVLRGVLFFQKVILIRIITL